MAARKKKLQESQIILLYLLIVCVLAGSFMCSLVLLYRHGNRTVVKKDISEFTKGNAADISCCIEEEYYDGQGNLNIIGWCVLRNVTYDYFNYATDTHGSEPYNHMRLCYVTEDSVYLLPTKLGLREDVSKALNDGIDYHYCGFYSLLLSEDLSIADGASLGIVMQAPDGTATCYIFE